jgi:hypothetical protein
MMKRILIAAGLVVFAVAFAILVDSKEGADSSFICPEDYPDEAAYMEGFGKFYQESLKENPDMTLEEFSDHRYELMKTHNCRGWDASDFPALDAYNRKSDGAMTAIGSISPFLLSPEQKTLGIASSSLGPYTTYADPETGVYAVNYSGGEDEWVVLNFYKPGLWSTRLQVLPREVFESIRENSGDRILFEFESPSEDNAGSAFYITMVYSFPEEKAADAYIVRIAELGNASYATTYARKFHGSLAYGNAIQWLSTEGGPFFTYVASLRPTPAWLKAL